jgi:Tol biopolymer transport system component
VFVGGPKGSLYFQLKEGVFEQHLLRPAWPDARWVDFTPDGRKVLFGGTRTGLKLMDLATKEVIWEIPTRPGHAMAGRFHPDGKHVFITNHDGTTYILRLPAELTEPKK